jgi:hypothetical protein
MTDKAIPQDTSFYNGPDPREGKAFLDNDVNQPIRSGAIMADGVATPRRFGAFFARSLTANATPQPVNFDAPVSYVTVYANGQDCWVQLGSSMDNLSRILVPNKQGTLLPMQDYRSIMIATIAGTCLVQVIFHDEPIRIWGA